MSIDSLSVKQVILPYQTQLKNLLRKIHKEYVQYHDWIDNSVQIIVGFTNSITQLAYAYTDNWDNLASFPRLHETVIDGINRDIKEQYTLCKEQVDKFTNCISTIEKHLETIKFIQSKIKEVLSDDITNQLYILEGVTTLNELIDTIDALICSFKKDTQMRQSIIDTIQKASLNQMGVYLSAWKYGPCLNTSVENKFKSIIQNELMD